MFWRKNLCKVPSGNAGKEFVKILCEWLRRFNCNLDCQGIAFTVFMVLPILLLQKPQNCSKAKDHCIESFKGGNLEEIFLECKSIQGHLKLRKNNQNYMKTFAKLMMQRKVNVALRFLSDQQRSGVLQLIENVFSGLEEKHTAPTQINSESLLYGPICNNEGIDFNINEQKIEVFARTLKGAAGPSQLDTVQYRRILCSKQFQKEGKDLRDQIATLAKRLAIDVLPTSLEAYTANRLIPLDKNPGIRPIGVGEVLRRLKGRAIALELKQDVKEAAGPIQVCAGHKAGSEAAIHAMHEIFQEGNSQGVLLIDASNAFNSLNRQVALHNIRILCPRASIIIIILTELHLGSSLRGRRSSVTRGHNTR